MGLFTIEWLEDVDLSGGTAAVALGLVAGQRGPWVQKTVDLAEGPSGDGAKIRGYWACNETVQNSGADFTVAENHRSPYEIGAIDTTITSPLTMQLGCNIPIPPRATLGHNGFDGTGAEQSAGVMLIEDPRFPDPWRFSAANDWDEVIIVNPTTNARVLDTISGHVDICGRTNAYTGAQAAIPSSSKTTIQVIHVTSNDVAGYSGACLERQGMANLMFPTVATTPTNYSMFDMFGAYPTCPADDPFNIAGVGVTTAAMTLSALTLGINWG